MRASDRAANPPSSGFNGTGFRVAKTAAAPTLASVAPNTGPTTGGTTITLTGTNLIGTTGVTIGGAAATGVTVVNATTVTAVTPAGTAGAQAVTITTPGGTATLPNAFTYFIPAPTLASVSPNVGGTSGGTVVTLTGTNLDGATAVAFGGTAATNVAVLNSTTIRATTPARAVGNVSVAVTTPGGTATLLKAFTYATSSEWYLVVEQDPDPAIVTDETLRNAIIATGYPWRILDQSSQIEMLLVPPGSYDMGCSASDGFSCSSWENPVHAVTLTEAFYIGRYEVTQAQWIATMGSNPSNFPSASAQVPTAQVLSRPVEQVSWNTVQGFLSATGFRLPTEAEWEYAYRAGTETAFHSMPGFPDGTNDDNQLANIAWFGSNSASQTRPVGGKAANALGLHDMSGNVWEWVNDWYSATYYAASPVENPPGPSTGAERVVRGGSWVGNSVNVRSSVRGPVAPDLFFNTIGFRVARTAAFAPPTLASVSPGVGGTLGGTVITLTGTNLTGPTSVTFGGAAATNVTVIDDTTVTAVAPAGAPGVVSVAITTPDGTATLPNAFTYVSVVTPAWATLLEETPDPAVVTDATLRGAIIATGWAWRVRDNASQIEMLLVPPGTFNMGCSPSTLYGCGADESPVHAVTLTNAFYMGRYEVTQAQWAARMGSNPSGFQSPSAQVPAAQVPNRPVETVSWNTIQGFLASTGLRLPTEAEWEYAYRAGTTTAFHSMPGFPNGTNDDARADNIAWSPSSANSQTRPVGQKAANGFGLHDMSGNVWEWMNDWYSSTYFASSPTLNPAGPATGTTRVLRGGAWNYAPGLRASFRSSPFSPPNVAGSDLGFRVARTP